MEKAVQQLQAQIVALTMTVKTLAAMVLVANVKDPARAGEVADLSRQMKDRLIAAVSATIDASPLALSPFRAEFEEQVRDALSGYFDEPAQMLDLIAKIGLELKEAPSDAKN